MVTVQNRPRFRRSFVITISAKQAQALIQLLNVLVVDDSPRTG
jgi:hypothetical protein